MKEELISSVSKVLQEWNPLGEKASSFDGLEGYRYEAMDILSAISIKKISVQESVESVLSQAFGLALEQSQLNFYSKIIEGLVSVH